MTDERICQFDSRGEAYRRAFEVFLAHTDQKQRARQWLTALVDRLPSRRVFLDAGAGDGLVTGWLAGSFERTIAIEPNPFLCEKLRLAVAGATVLQQPILRAAPDARADFVLCSHTFYYIDRAEWLAHLERLVSWLSPSGVAVVVLQDRETDCMSMVEHFLGHRFDLQGLAGEFRAKYDARYHAELHRGDAHVRTQDFDSAYTVAEFMLNLLPISAPPSKPDVMAYVRSRFACETGYRLSCHQNFLEIRPRR